MDKVSQKDITTAHYMICKSAKTKEYLIEIDDQGRVNVRRLFINSISKAMEIADMINFPIDEKWDKLELPRKLVQELGDGETLYIDDFVINCHKSGRFEISQECKPTAYALREIANHEGYQYETRWNTQTLGSKLVDYLTDLSAERNNILTVVREDITAYLSQATDLCYNERDLQMRLAFWLVTKSQDAYDKVHLEYDVPVKELDQRLKQQGLSPYPWGNNLRMDLVVEKNGVFVPIELKYRTKSIKRSGRHNDRFGETMSSPVVILKNQAAQNEGRYDFWKDVHRIELVTHSFNNVAGGIALFVTNDESYFQKPNEKADYFRFNMSPGTHGIERSWQNADSGCGKHRKGFDLLQEYKIEERRPISVDGVPLYYNLLSVTI